MSDLAHRLIEVVADRYVTPSSPHDARGAVGAVIHLTPVPARPVEEAQAPATASPRSSLRDRLRVGGKDALIP
jgi:hypothetical protein